MVDEKLKKAAIKEGGKKGVDAAGMSDLGGVKYFHIAVETPDGDHELLECVLTGMNAEVDDAAEERKGGAGGIAKMLLSAGDSRLAIIVHVPKALAEEKGVSAKDWVDRVLKPLNPTILSEGEEIIKAEIAKADGVFPLKVRDEISNAGFAFLREKGLVPEADDSDDDYIPDPEAAGIGEW